MATRRLDALHKSFHPRVTRFLAAVKASEIDLLVYCTKRSSEESARLWRQGRTGRAISGKCQELAILACDVIDGTRQPTKKQIACSVVAGITTPGPWEPVDKAVPTAVLQVARYLHWQSWLINHVGPQHESPIVTNALPGESAHNHGLAFDCVPIVHGKLAWNAGPLWDKLGGIAAEHQIEWSGTWTSFVEKVHFQLPNWRGLGNG